MEHEKLPISILSYYSVFNKTGYSRNIAENILEKRLIEKYKVNKEELNTIITCEKNAIKRRGENQNEYFLFGIKSLDEILNAKFTNLTISELILQWDVYCKVINILKKRQIKLEKSLREAMRDKSGNAVFDIMSNLKDTKTIIKDYKKGNNILKKLKQEKYILAIYSEFALSRRKHFLRMSGTEHYDTEFFNFYKHNPYYYTTNIFIQTEKEYLNRLNLFNEIEKELELFNNPETDFSFSLRLK